MENDVENMSHFRFVYNFTKPNKILDKKKIYFSHNYLIIIHKLII